MKEIVIISPKHGQFIVTLDDDVFDSLSKYKWGVRVTKGKAYARRNAYSKQTGNNYIDMHRLIMGAIGSELVVDHIDGNTLNNTKSNLRICTQNGNTKNQKLSVTNKKSKNLTYRRNSKYYL